MLPKTVLYYGSSQKLPEPVVLTAGPLTMQFEPLTGFLRYIRLGDHEIVRAIYAAIRDQNWGTVPPQLHNLRSKIEKDSFKLQFDVRCEQKEIDYLWRGTITGGPDGSIQYQFDGKAGSEFFRNRIGICLLHPMTECAGQPCTVVHSDGTEEKGEFPKTIAPWQPFFDVRQISYRVGGTTARIAFEGDDFEMEDQRNWSDASFKTYCTPQIRPKPQLIRAGEEVHQKVTLRLEKPAATLKPVLLGSSPELTIASAPVHPLPPIGFALPQDLHPLTLREVERLRQLRPGHLRIDLPLASGDSGRRLAMAVEQALAVNAPLYVGLILSDAAAQELATLADHVARLKPRIGLWLVFHEKEEFVQQRWVTLAREILEPAAPGTDFAAGTLDFFTELNRNRPPADSPSLPCFSQNPQVHAFDLATMVENLYGAASSLDALRTFSTKAAVISPVTLKIRSKRRIDSEGELPPDVDPRQMSLFAAGWTVGSVAQLAAAGNVRSLTYFETIGWRGLMEREAGSLAADIFPSKPESVFPLYHVFADIAQFAAGQIQRTCSSHPLLVTGLTLVDEKGGRRILVANLSAGTQQLKIDCGDCCAAIRYLDETNAERAMNDCEVFRREPGAPARSSAGKLSVRLLPFAVARVDIDPEAC